MFAWLLGKHRNQSTEYLEPGRLEDVIALIQVLGLDSKTHRGDNALNAELCDKPDSATSWSELAKKHSEFFRVYDGKDGASVSLIARHVSRRGEDGGPVLTADYIHGLVRAAIQIHQGQIQRQQIRGLVGLLAALGGVIVTVIGILQAIIGFLKH